MSTCQQQNRPPIQKKDLPKIDDGLPRVIKPSFEIVHRKNQRSFDNKYKSGAATEEVDNNFPPNFPTVPKKIQFERKRESLSGQTVEQNVPPPVICNQASVPQPPPATIDLEP